jgi:damage-control phosphatase, subfamily I
MRIHLRCVPCLFEQALSAARTLGLSYEDTRRLVRRVNGAVEQMDWEQPAPLMGRNIHHAIRSITGVDDPYAVLKREHTEAALALLPEAQQAVDGASHPFATAVQISIGGNLIDLGSPLGREVEVEDCYRQALARPVDAEGVRELERRVAKARDVLFLADNAGEIVFDRPLLRLIGADRLTVAVRGGPVINDATLEDAARAGLTDRYRVITTGSDVPGIWPDRCEPAFRARLEEADLVIAKGQGNFETLSEWDREVFFLFLVKCGAVADELGEPLGTAVARPHWR